VREGHSADNLALEIHSLKLVYNQTLQDCVATLLQNILNLAPADLPRTHWLTCSKQAACRGARLAEKVDARCEEVFRQQFYLVKPSW
jgi:hypothetical protein